MRLVSPIYCFFLHLLQWIHMLGLLSHKLLKVFDVFHVNIRRNSISCKEYYHILLRGCGVITETQISVHLLSPFHPHKIEKVLMRNFPEDRVFFGVFYRNLASSRFVITIYCFVAKYIPYLLKMYVENLISAHLKQVPTLKDSGRVIE